MTYLVLRLKPLRDLFEIPLYAALGLLLVQIILGGLTVLQLIDPGIVSLHLFNAILFLGVLLWIHAKAEESLRRRSPVATPRTKSLFYLGLTFIILLLAQIFLGGMVSTNFAGTVCPDFPACFGNWWPRGSYLINLQMGHRYLGFLLTAVAILFSILGIGYPGGTRIIHAVRLLPVLIIAQIALGVVNVLYSLPKWSSLLHLANAVFMFIIAALAAFELAHQAFTPRPKQAIKDAHT